MKSVLALVILVAGSVAFAQPKVGDDVIYDSVDGQDVGQSERTLLNVDLANNQCMEQWSNAADKSNSTTDIDKCSNMDFSPYTQEHCAQAHGVMEQVTVPAGTFMTCKIRGNGGTINIGDVPFGMVKAVITDPAGQNETLQLHSFKHGTL